VAGSVAGSRTPVTLKSYRDRRNSNAKTPSFPVAVPFPTVQEEDEESETGVYSFSDDELFRTHTLRDSSSSSSSSEGFRRSRERERDWADEVARRQENIRELRDRKIRLEQVQAQASRARKASQKPHFSYLTSSVSPSPGYGETRKLTPDDLDFISELHASVVWRLWHENLSSEVFASERLLATRLHLVLMRYGRKDIPVPPIVALSKPSHSHHSHTSHMMQTFSTRYMMEKDRPGVRSLEQLVAKSLLRQGQPRKKIRNGGVMGKLLRSRSQSQSQRMGSDHQPSPLSGEPITSSSF